MSDTFIKFPHTPHLLWLGNKSPRADKVFSPAEVEKLLRGDVIIEEKVDGANLGLSVGPQREILAQNRGNWLRRGGHAQFDGLWAWLDQRQVNLVESLGAHLLLFGEWCLAVHTVKYNNLPDWFLGFDVYDRKEGRFWDVVRRDALCHAVGVQVVPRLAQGHFTTETLKEILKHPSKVGGDALEGIYIRSEGNGWLTARAKIVRPEFAQSIGDHWSGGPMRRNTVCARPGGDRINDHHLTLAVKREAHKRAEG